MGVLGGDGYVNFKKYYLEVVMMTKVAQLAMKWKHLIWKPMKAITEDSVPAVFYSIEDCHKNKSSMQADLNNKITKL